MTVVTDSSLEEVLSKKSYQALFLDAYGVFWAGNARGGYPGSHQTMERLVSSGKIVGVVSNSTQLSSIEIPKYAEGGFIQGKHFHFLVTSGDVARKVFLSDTLPFSTPNKKYIFFCPPHPRFALSSSLFDGSPFVETAEISEADFIYINVPHISGEDQEEKSAFSNIVKTFIKSNKPMVCANPDAFALEGASLRPVVRQGSIASLYEEMGGRVFYIGKPFSPIYALALEKLNQISSVSKEKVLMVGDTPETDVRGAFSFGIQSALITCTGIMAERMERQGPSVLQDLPVTDIPNFFIEQLSAKEVL